MGVTLCVCVCGDTTPAQDSGFHSQLYHLKSLSGSLWGSCLPARRLWAGWNGIFVKTGRLEMGARFALSSAESRQVSRSRCSLARLGGESVSVFKIANHIYLFIFVCMCVCLGACVLWRSEGNLWKLVLCPSHERPGHLTQVPKAWRQVPLPFMEPSC